LRFLYIFWGSGLLCIIYGYWLDHPLPSDIDELEEVVEEEDSFLTLLLEHVVPTSGLVVGVDSAEGEVGGGEQGCTIISGKFKVNFCLILCELLLGLLLKGELGTEDSVSCLIDNTVLSDSVEDWTSEN
jgi:hypothetical protein